MNTKKRAQIAALLMLQESLCVSLRQSMSVQTVSEHSQISTEITWSLTRVMNLVTVEMQLLATRDEDGGGEGYPY